MSLRSPDHALGREPNEADCADFTERLSRHPALSHAIHV